MDKKEQLAEQYAQGKSSSSVFQEAHKRDFLAGYEAGIKASTEFEKGEKVQVTDVHHFKTNMWFTREFIQKDSDGKFACRQYDRSVARWDFIRKNIE